MTTLPLFQKYLVGLCLTGSAGCLAAILAYCCRSELQRLHSKWIATTPFTKALCILALTLGVLYGGTKPPSSTNEPPGSVSGDTTSTNEPPVIVDGDTPTNDPPTIAEGDAPTNAPSPLLMAGRPRPALMMPPPSQQSQPPPSTQTVTNWTIRGAWNDWIHITFPDSFEFPFGTNMLTKVTLMSQGSLRECLANPTAIFALPQPVSLEPGVSSCAYGLTASNSFLIAWSNVCVERDPTNRVDASIELFDSGACCVRFGACQTDYPPIVPEGFFGEAQNDAWLAAAFPGDYAAITNDGYAAWLADHIGHNEPNGRYKCTVTVNALPEHGPCYLVCGPYKMVVKEPGDYCFPLMDFEKYDLYTAPTDVPLTWADDDGWEFPASDSAPLLMSPRPRRLLGTSSNGHHRYKIQRFPEVFVHPNCLTREEALNEMITVSCNAAGIAAHDYTSLSGRAILFYTNPSTVQIREADIQDAIYFYFERNGVSVCGTLSIYEHHYCPYWPDCPYGDDCVYYYGNSSNSTNGTSNASTP